MEKKPGECCSTPVCEWKTQQGSFTGTGTISGHGVGKSSERNSVSGRLSKAVSLVQELSVDMV